MILGENNEKMSKSRGNVVNPDDMVESFGADTFRTYEMFIGAFDQSTPWSINGVKGCYRFMERVWNMQEFLSDEEDYSEDLESTMHKTVKKVTEDIERMKFNTAIATLMALVNDVYKKGSITRGEMRTFLLLLNPTAPHITEEMWERAGFEGCLNEASWPTYDEAKTVDDVVEIVAQINGKVKDRIMISANLSKEEMEQAVLENDTVKKLIDGKTIVKVICVPGKLVNIVVR